MKHTVKGLWMKCCILYQNNQNKQFIANKIYTENRYDHKI